MQGDTLTKRAPPFAEVGAVTTLLRYGLLREGMTIPSDCSESDVSNGRAEEGR